jgi:filamentous hemagglutinin
MGVGKGTDASGKVKTVIGTSEPNGYLRPAVRAAIREDEEIAGGFGHAEQNIVSYMSQNGIKPITVGAGRPICPPCAQTIEGVAASPATPLKVPATQPEMP